MQQKKTVPPCHRATSTENKAQATVYMYMYKSKLCILLLLEYLFFFCGTVWHAKNTVASVARKKKQCHIDMETQNL